MNTPFNASGLPKPAVMPRLPHNGNRSANSGQPQPFPETISRPHSNTPNIFRQDILTRLRLPILRYHE